MPDYISNMLSQFFQQMLGQNMGQLPGGRTITQGGAPTSPSGRNLTPFTQQQLQAMAAGGNPNAIHALGGPMPNPYWNQPQQYQDASAWVANFEQQNGRKPTMEERQAALDPATIQRNQARQYGYANPQTPNTSWANYVMNNPNTFSKENQMRNLQSYGTSYIPGSSDASYGGGGSFQTEDPMAAFRELSKGRVNFYGDPNTLVGGGNIGTGYTGSGYMDRFIPGKAPLPTALMSNPLSSIGSPPTAPSIPQAPSNLQNERAMAANKWRQSFGVF